MIGEKDLAIAGKMLDLCALKHKLIAHNIANAEVPGYRKLTLSFEKELQRAIASKDPEEIRQVSAAVTRAKEPGLDSEAEIAGMAKNQILFETFAQIASYRFRMLRAAIR